MSSNTQQQQQQGGEKTSILGLPLAPSLPEYLTPDPAVPTVSALLSLSTYDSEHPPATDDPSKDGYVPKPTILRRSRPVHNSHFSYTTPLPLSFPYAVKPHQVRPRKVPGEAVGDGSAVKEGAPEAAAAQAQKDGPSRPQALNVEDYLASLEPDLSEPVKPVIAGDARKATPAYTSEARRDAVGTPVLAGLSAKSVADLFPTLDVGDAFEFLKSGSDAGGEETAKRNELEQFLAGHIVAVQEAKDGKRGFAPWSLCYGGHQFGSWASQLGDGRAISIYTTPSKWPTYEQDNVYYPPVAELQLKGAGRTPYSRFADGLAVLRSSVREYLGSEAMAALGVPTSRALSLVHLPDVDVAREEMETAAVVCRVAPSWLRIGSFELPWSRDQWDTLRDLVNYAGREVFGFAKTGNAVQGGPEDKSLAARVLREASRRNARTFARWQACGFMHGVLNTDNISISGLTIDYGPYAFMDIYSSNHICNHSDGEGRYSYRNQPPIGVDAVQKFGNALSEIIGCELEMARNGDAGEGPAGAPKGWAEDTSKLEAWHDEGLKGVEEIASEFMAVHIQEYKRLMSQKLGLLDSQQSDFTQLFTPLLELMERHKLDFSGTFRLLTQFESTTSKTIDAFLDRLLPKAQVPEHLRDTCREDWKSWLSTWQARLEESEKSGGAAASSRRKRMAAHNPRFILRQWVLEETIKRLEQDNNKAFLQRVLDMATNPFEEYGEDAIDPTVCTKPTDEVQEQRRLCSLGDNSMLGFQCSCSS